MKLTERQIEIIMICTFIIIAGIVWFGMYWGGMRNYLDVMNRIDYITQVVHPVVKNDSLYADIAILRNADEPYYETERVRVALPVIAYVDYKGKVLKGRNEIEATGQELNTFGDGRVEGDTREWKTWSIEKDVLPSCDVTIPDSVLWRWNMDKDKKDR